jgi:hypothetical protein
MESAFTTAPNPRGDAKYAPHTKSKRPSLITIPERAHPLAKLVFGEMKVAGKTYLDMEWESGVLVTTLKAWRTHSRPGLETAEAALGALGWSLVPVPRMKRLPEKLQAELDRLAGEWATEEPILHHLLSTCCRAPFIVRTGRTERKLRRPARKSGKAPAR